MRYTIDAVVLCDRGRIRSKNQDNFWFNHSFLAAENNGLPVPVERQFKHTDFPVFAVFDGMGGENHGEVAAWLAAKTFDEYYKQTAGSSRSGTQAFLAEVCGRMNAAVCDYAREHRTGNMGSTAAILAFCKREVYVCNIGDSKVFQYSDGVLAQISQDHVTTVAGTRKPSLTQNLGIPEDEFVLEPYIAKGECQYGDRYVICSDGITDMLEPDVIKGVLIVHKSTRECAEKLMELAMTAGGADNTTIIVCDVSRGKGLL